MQKRLILNTVMLLVACLPLLLFAYLGSHSRMIHDDFGVAAVGLELGAWDGLVYYYNRWTSAYSTIFLKLSLAKYAVALPPLVALAIIGIGLVGLYWLSFQLFDRLRLTGPRRVLALGASALVLASAINAFYTPESFYWYSASIQYTVPLVCLIGCLALAGCTVDGANDSRRLTLGAVACALISFLTAGASEMFLVFQATFLSLLATLAFAVFGRQRRRALAIVAGAMLMATAAGVIVQLASPGIWNRMAADAATYRPPVRSVSQLAVLTIQITFESIGRQEAIAGFALLFGLGVFLGLRTELPRESPSCWAAGFARAALLGLIIQFAFLPILWAQQSDDPQFFGRFSPGFMLVICLNMVLLFVFLFALWQRQRLQAALNDRAHGSTVVTGALLSAFVLLVAITQVRSIDARASTYLFATALGMLKSLAMLSGAGDSDSVIRKLGQTALGMLLIAWASIAALILATFIGHGFTSHRMMAGPAFLQVFAGLLWGLRLGISLKTSAHAVTSRIALERLLRASGLLLAIAIGGGILLGQARLVPDLRAYAREWDARHEAILAQRGSGKRQIEVAPLSFDLADYIGMGSLSSAERYYGVESIQIVEA